MSIVPSPEDEMNTSGRPLVAPSPPESQVPTSRPWVDYLNMIKNLIADVNNPHLTAAQRSKQAAIVIRMGLVLLENLVDTFDDGDKLQAWIDIEREKLKNISPPRLKMESAVSQGIRVLKIKTTDPTMNEDAPSETLGPFAYGQLREQAHEGYLNALLDLVADVVMELTIRRLLPMDLEKEEDDDWEEDETESVESGDETESVESGNDIEEDDADAD